MEPKEVKPENNSVKALMEEAARKKEADQKRNYLIGGIILILSAIIIMFVVQGVKIHQVKESIADVNIKELSDKVDTMSKKINNVVMPSLGEYKDIIQEFRQKQNDFASKSEVDVLNNGFFSQEKKLRLMKKEFEKYVKDHYKSDDKTGFKMPTSKELKKLETEFLKKTTQDSIVALKKPFDTEKPTVIDKPIIAGNNKPSVDAVLDILVADTTKTTVPKKSKNNQIKPYFEKLFGIKK